ncbi:hypothetical protein [Pedobacter sp. UBA5917]|uniref:hypothetical protein n=1 Tax=Pedobacter sp. UBA5917 TaxID=1947061 RepID=UPI0025EA107E|nr:hypothetical protein [Pedobacter sp. UBA5917]
MKALSNILIIALLFFGCRPTEDKTNQQKLSKNDTSGQSITEIADQLHGDWISKEYIDNIRKTKSIFGSHNYKTTVLVAQLLKEELVGDTATLYGLSDHEGGYRAFLKFDKKKNKFASDPLRLKEYQSFEVPFELNYISPNLLEIHSTRTNKRELYEKMKCDFDELLRNTLTTGTYSLQNSGELITFSDKGKVNFKNFTHYDMVSDFVEGVDFDAIYFCEQTTNNGCIDGDVYSFKIEGKNLYLERMKDNGDLSYTATGEKYILINKSK